MAYEVEILNPPLSVAELCTTAKVLFGQSDAILNPADELFMDDPRRLAAYAAAQPLLDSLNSLIRPILNQKAITMKDLTAKASFAILYSRNGERDPEDGAPLLLSLARDVPASIPQ